MKKLFSLFLVLLISVSLTACSEDITLTIDITDVSLIEGDAHTIIFSTNDTRTPSFVSTDDSVVMVDELGVVTAVGEGVATISVTSKTDTEVKLEVVFTVSKLITLTSTDSTINLVGGDTYNVVTESNDDFTYSSSNT